MGSLSITWELVTNADSEFLPKATESEFLGGTKESVFQQVL